MIPNPRLHTMENEEESKGDLLVSEQAFDTHKNTDLYNETTSKEDKELQTKKSTTTQ